MQNPGEGEGLVTGQRPRGLCAQGSLSKEVGDTAELMQALRHLLGLPGAWLTSGIPGAWRCVGRLVGAQEVLAEAVPLPNAGWGWRCGAWCPWWSWMADT